MDKFKIGDKVYDKQGYSRKEVGTVCDMNENKIKVRLFSNPVNIAEFHLDELRTEQEHKNLEDSQNAQIRCQMEENKNKWEY